MPTIFMVHANCGEAMNSPPRPRATRVSRVTAPTVVPARKGSADLKPVVWPMVIMDRLPAPGVPVMTMTNITKAA